MKQKLIHFNAGITDNDYLMQNNELKKKGLILIEGVQTDSKRRKHTFTPERLEEIVFNTNQALENGERIPLLEDHQKSQAHVVGDLTGTLRAELITEENLPNPKFKSLIGKVGVFVDEMTIKSNKAIQQAKENLLYTVSSGLDPVANIIKEVSFTPTPAIHGCVSFKSANFGDNNTALTFDDLDQSDNDMEQIEEAYEELTEKLWTITKNIQMADDDLLDGTDPIQLQMDALQQFNDRFLELIGANEEQEQEQQGQDPRMNQPNQGYRPGNTNLGRSFSNGIPLAAFSMQDMENINSSKKKRFS